jgi:hypothetical protein
VCRKVCAILRKFFVSVQLTFNFISFIFGKAHLFVSWSALFNSSTLTLILTASGSVADPDHFDADPDPDPTSEKNLMRIRIRIRILLINLNLLPN